MARHANLDSRRGPSNRQGVSRPPLRRSTNAWFKVQKVSNNLPFEFRPDHPKNFHHSDFGIWAAFDPGAASQVFSPVLMEVFAYSWRTMARLAGYTRVPSSPAEARSYGVVNELKAELGSWGNLLTHLWIAPHHEEPCLYKLIPAALVSWPAFRCFRQPDGRTPRAFRFEELAFSEREYVGRNPNSDDPDDEWPNLTLKQPNLGIQLEVDDSLLTALPRGWGFDSRGSMTFIGLSHDEWRKQNVGS